MSPNIGLGNSVVWKNAYIFPVVSWYREIDIIFYSMWPRAWTLWVLNHYIHVLYMCSASQIIIYTYYIHVLYTCSASQISISRLPNDRKQSWYKKRGNSPSFTLWKDFISIYDSIQTVMNCFLYWYVHVMFSLLIRAHTVFYTDTCMYCFLY